MISLGAFTSELIREQFVFEVSFVHAAEHVQLFSSIHL